MGLLLEATWDRLLKKNVHDVKWLDVNKGVRFSLPFPTISLSSSYYHSLTSIIHLVIYMSDLFSPTGTVTPLLGLKEWSHRGSSLVVDSHWD